MDRVQELINLFVSEMKESACICICICINVVIDTIMAIQEYDCVPISCIRWENLISFDGVQINDYIAINIRLNYAIKMYTRIFRL